MSMFIRILVLVASIVIVVSAVGMASGRLISPRLAKVLSPVSVAIVLLSGFWMSRQDGQPGQRLRWWLLLFGIWAAVWGCVEFVFTLRK